MYSNKLLLLFFLGLFLVSRTTAQDGCYTCSRDSLLIQFSASRTTAEKVKLLRWIIDFAPTADSANYFIEQLISLNPQDKDLAPYKKIQLGNVYRMKNENGRALQLYQEAVFLFDQKHKRIPNLLLGFRNLYNLLNRQEERYRYYKKKLDEYLSTGPYENTAACYHGIAGYFAYTADYNQAISYYLKGAEVFKNFYPYWYYNAMGIVGIYYAEWGNFTKALTYLDFALPKIKATRGVLETANGYY
jgi:tetratricopeptide (TPR) repeat protein